MQKHSKRYIVRETCGCRAPDPGRGKIPTGPRILHCQFHAAAEEMLWLIAAISFDRNGDSKWQDLARQILKPIQGEFDDRVQSVQRYIGAIEKVRAHYLDAEQAILAGAPQRLGRNEIECRLCGETLDADVHPASPTFACRTSRSFGLYSCELEGDRVRPSRGPGGVKSCAAPEDSRMWQGRRADAGGRQGDVGRAVLTFLAVLDLGLCELSGLKVA